MFRDLTSRLELASAELRRERARFRVFFDALPLACVVTDGFSLVRSVNRAAEVVTGPLPRLVGRPLLTLLPEEDLPLGRTRVVRARLGEPAAWEGRVVGAGGELVRVRMTVTPLGEGPEPKDGAAPPEYAELLWTLRPLEG
ncbi:MAG TPA: PAS domain-containing protein [Phycisphaerales bacterium]|nr:PAS domain-containing protein [Phycisphaerales bacterium]